VLTSSELFLLAQMYGSLRYLIAERSFLLYGEPGAPNIL